MASSMFHGEDDITLANALNFARHVCQSIEDMSGLQFAVRSDTLVNGKCPDLFPITVFIQFYGKITGHYIISISEKTAAALNGDGSSAATPEIIDRKTRKESNELLKEMLNVATGQSIGGLEASYGQLTHLTPIVVSGSIEFPPMLSASVEIESRVGTIICIANLDLAELKIGRKLEEAQNKLDAVRVSQKSMWMQPAELPDARFSIVYKSLNEAGGDLYDVIKIADDQYGYFVGDVSGHDISTAFIAASMRALIKQNCVPGSDPIESMQTINKVLYELLSDVEYITGCYALLDRSRGLLKVINMGHPPLVFIPRNGQPESVSFAGDVLGAFKTGKYLLREIPIRQGDRFIMYTDGLLDLYGGSDGSIGDDFHAMIAETVRTAPLEKMAENVFYSSRNQNKLLRDDVIVLGVEV